jgi:hypothetical protein
MRLFRRSLLCLVVGVTAFGVAGWAFRPRAKWSVTVSEPGFDQQFQFHEDDVVEGPPGIVWLWSARTMSHNKREDMFVGVDEASGRVLRRIKWNETANCVPLPDGRLLFDHEERSAENGRTEWTMFRLTDADGRRIVERRWKGFWRRMSDGLTASGIEWRKDGAEFQIRDIVSGRTIRRLLFDDILRDTSEFGVSMDGKRLVVGERLFKNRSSPFGLELWDLERGSLVRRLRLPTFDPTSTQEGAIDPRFSSSRPIVFFSWNRPLEKGASSKFMWRYDSASENDVTQEARPVAVQSDVKLKVPWTEGVARGCWLWNTVDEDRSQFWFSIQNDEREVLPWRKFPFPIIPIEIGDVFYESYEPGCRLIPGMTAMIFSSKVRPVHDLLPEGWRWGEWKYDAPATCYLWHDWKTNTWRDVGLRTDFTDLGDGFHDKVRIVRSNALLAVRDDLREGTIIESWPLPPRDPKWPALGVAALATAGTWWGCANRYARRMRAVA